MFDLFGRNRIRELTVKLKEFELMSDEAEKLIHNNGYLKGSAGIIALEVYKKKLISSAKVIFTAMRNDAERGNLTASKVRAYRKKFFECEQDSKVDSINE